MKRDGINNSTRTSSDMKIDAKTGYVFSLGTQPREYVDC